MGRNARSKGKSASCKGIGRRGGKTKTKVRDLDQIKKDIADRAADGLTDQDGPYCIECARSFQSKEILLKHMTSKAHKHRLRRLKDWPNE